MFRALVSASLTVVVMYGCSQQKATLPEFDGNRAYDYLVKQVSFGPRVPGSAAWSACRDYYYQHFLKLGLQVDSQVFSFFDPYSHQELPLVNIIVRVRGGHATGLPILLMAHWDTRPRTDFHSDPKRIDEPIQGANDGASGVAVLMELANLLAQSPPDCAVDMVLVDGEDWGKPGDIDYYLMGSKYFAAADGGIRGRYRFGIVVDMIGDRDQQIHRESYSEKFQPELNDMIWSAALELGVTTFIDSVRESIIDDHISINAGGVPAVNLIDFEYPYWHTEHDTPDKCSPEALKNVGTVLVYVIYNESLWP
jgi:hypothetical protein